MPKLAIKIIFILICLLCVIALIAGVLLAIGFNSSVLDRIVLIFVPIRAIGFIREKIALELLYVITQFAMITGLFFFVLSARKSRVIIYVVASFVLVDSFLMWQANTYFSGRYNDKVNSDLQPAALLLKEIHMPERLHVIFPSVLYDEETKPIWREWDMLLTGNAPLYYEVPLLSGSAMSLVPRYVTSFNERFGLNFEANEVDVDFSKVLLLGASKVILLKKEHSWNADFNFKMDGSGYQVYESSRAGPRFYLTEKVSPFVFNWEVAATNPYFDRNDYDPVSVSFVADEDLDRSKTQLTHVDDVNTDHISSVSYGNEFFNSRAGKITLKKYDWERVDFDVNIIKPSLMVLTDHWYPGWNVYVDSKKDKIIRANYVFRGVWLEPGNHRVSFVFENVLVKTGRIISVVGIAWILIWAFFYRYQTRGPK